MKVTAAYLPDDIWVHILLRLRAKTILRCLSVCKSWQLLIQHPDFIYTHLQHQKHDLMLVRCVPEQDVRIFGTRNHSDKDQEPKPEVYSLHYDDESFSLYAEHKFPILGATREHFRVVGSCNGIICVSNDQFGIRHETYIWNPTIQKCIELPRPMFTFDKIGKFDHELGFGFDEITNDYKVIRVVDASDRASSLRSHLEVEIFSLSTGVWRKASHLASNLGVRIFLRYLHGWTRDSQAYINGVVHWVCWDGEQSCSVVVAFHLRNEVFSCFEPPMDIKGDSYFSRRLHLVVYQGSLSLIKYSPEKCIIWMMKDCGASSSWNKYLDIDLCYVVDRVIGLRSRGELLVEIQGGLYSIDPEAVEIQERDLSQWIFRQEGQMAEYFDALEYVHSYDRENAPKGLGIRSRVYGFFCFSIHSERYMESLALLGRMNSSDGGNEGKGTKTYEDGNSVVDLLAERQLGADEGKQLH